MANWPPLSTWCSGHSSHGMYKSHLFVIFLFLYFKEHDIKGHNDISLLTLVPVISFDVKKICLYNICTTSLQMKKH